MDIARVGQVPAFRADGVLSHVLLRLGTFESHNLLIAWTVVAPGRQRRGHIHPGTEEAYIVISGRARVQVGSESQIVSPGAMVYVPPNMPHLIGNAGSENLIYISVASPPFPVERLYAAQEVAQAIAE